MAQLIVEASLDSLRRLRELQARRADLEAKAAARRLPFHDDPATFAREAIRWPAGTSLAPYQADVLAGLSEHHRAAVRALHGVGKTAMAALAVLWFSLTRDAAGIDWKVVTTAGAWRQLERYLWPEIKLWSRRLRWDVLGRPAWSETTELLTLNLKLRHGAAFAVASDDPALIEGAHAAEILYVFDESKAVSAETFDAAEGAFSTGIAYALAISTPGAPVGRFYDIHKRRPGLEDWWCRHIRLDEAVGAGRINPEWAEQRRRQWGEASAVYRNRVLGEFAAADEDGIVPLAWVEAAIERWKAWQDDGAVVDAMATPGIVGVDVARSGADQTVYATRYGDVVATIERRKGHDTMATAGELAGRLRSAPGVAVVDVIGLGAGVYDRLLEQHLRVIAFTASSRSALMDHTGQFGFANRRAEAWWRLRERLDPDSGSEVCLPDDDELIGDLTAPRWSVVSSGKIKVESKDEISKRIGRSTDVGDAVVMAFAGHAGTALADPRQTVRGYDDMPEIVEEPVESRAFWG